MRETRSPSTIAEPMPATPSSPLLLLGAMIASGIAGYCFAMGMRDREQAQASEPPPFFGNRPRTFNA